MSAQNEEVVRGVYEAFGSGDVPAVLGAMAADIEWIASPSMPYGAPYHSPAEVAEKLFGPLLEDIPDFGVEAEELISAGDSVVAIVHYTGTGAATGKSLDLSVVHVWDVHDGKLTRFRQFIDTVKFLEVARAGAGVAA